MTEYQLRKLAAWIRTHDCEVSENIEDGYLVVYSEVVDRAGNVTRESDRIRNLSQARAVLGY